MGGCHADGQGVGDAPDERVDLMLGVAAPADLGVAEFDAVDFLGGKGHVYVLVRGRTRLKGYGRV